MIYNANKYTSFIKSPVEYVFSHHLSLTLQVLRCTSAVARARYRSRSLSQLPAGFRMGRSCTASGVTAVCILLFSSLKHPHFSQNLSGFCPCFRNLIYSSSQPNIYLSSWYAIIPAFYSVTRLRHAWKTS